MSTTVFRPQMAGEYANFREDKLEMGGLNTSGKSRAAGLFLGILCFILLAVILVLVASNNAAINSRSQHQLRSNEIENLTLIVMELQARLNNLTETIKETPGKRAPCPPRFVEIYRECLYISPKGVTKSWLSSKTDCEERGGRLATIKTRQKLQALSLFYNHAWIGLSDKKAEGVWKWVDGTPLQVDFWMKDEPNNHDNNEDCAHLSVEGNAVGFNDNSCGTSFSYICEEAGEN